MVRITPHFIKTETEFFFFKLEYLLLPSSFILLGTCLEIENVLEVLVGSVVVSLCIRAGGW